MKKGFTLVELLAVIIILAIIAVISIPIALNTINVSDKKLFETNVKSLIEECELKYETDDNNPKVFTFPGAASTLDFKGDIPTSGTITINEVNGEYDSVSVNKLISKNGKWCAMKTNSGDLTIYEYDSSTDQCK